MTKRLLEEEDGSLHPQQQQDEHAQAHAPLEQPALPQKKRARKPKRPAAAAAAAATDDDDDDGEGDDEAQHSHVVAAAVPTGDDEDEAQLPQFIASLHELISNPATTHIVTWLPLNDGRVHFVVKDVDAFTTQILPKYYRTHKMTSFMRQLNNYGFSKVKSTDQNDKTYEFEHEHNLLQPNRPDLLFKIERRRTAKRGGGGHHDSPSKRASARPSGQQLFRVSTAVPTGHERQLQNTVAQLQAQLAAQAALLARGGVTVPIALTATAAAASSGAVGATAFVPSMLLPRAASVAAPVDPPALSRPRRTASLAARDAIKAAVQDDVFDARVADDDNDRNDDDDDDGADDGADADNNDGGASGAAQVLGGSAADDESSEFVESANASVDGSPASLSEVAQAERSQAQIGRLRLHEDNMSLARGPAVNAVAASTGAAAAAAAAPTSAPQFAFAVPQAPAKPQVVVQARVGLTRSGEVWKSMIESAVVDPAPVVNSAAAQLMSTMDMPRTNSVSDFFGVKREAAENALDAAAEFRDSLPDDTRGFLKSSHGIF